MAIPTIAEIAETLWKTRCRHFGEKERPLPNDERKELMEAYAKAILETYIS